MRTTAYLFILAVLAAGCGTKTVQIDADATAAQATRWNGTLSAPSGMEGVVQIQGRTWMGADGNQTTARIDINNATRGGEHPWHVHEGRCGSGGRIVGDAGTYGVLKIDSDGRASREVRLNMPLPTYGDYHVNVHAATSNMQTIVACANLAAPTTR
ncbi:MAG TPA: hypothetical protein VMN60_04435 [Longimicrobiales bacterium]|nr:hypothetical protein [Longimicrobiales bacterium]